MDTRGRKRSQIVTKIVRWLATTSRRSGVGAPLQLGRALRQWRRQTSQWLIQGHRSPLEFAFGLQLGLELELELEFWPPGSVATRVERNLRSSCRYLWPARWARRPLGLRRASAPLGGATPNDATRANRPPSRAAGPKAGLLTQDTQTVVYCDKYNSVIQQVLGRVVVLGSVPELACACVCGASLV